MSYGAHLRVIAPLRMRATQLLPKKSRSGGNSVFDLTGPRFEPQIFRSRDEHINSFETVASHIDFQNVHKAISQTDALLRSVPLYFEPSQPQQTDRQH